MYDRALARPEPSLPVIRLMMVDDSAVVRAVLSRMLAPWPDFAIVAEAGGVDEALALLDRIDVDVILLDIEMPGMDGLTALPELLARSRGARVMIVSSSCDDGAEATVRALTLGAADTLPKPGAQSFGGRFSQVLADKLLKAGRRREPQVAGPIISRVDPTTSVARTHGVECLAIGSSTGGLHALASFFAALPDSFAAPILVTQHLPPVFMPYFARQLAQMARRPARVARDGDRVLPGEILVAPGEAHMVPVRRADGVRIMLESGAAATGCCPSVDPMLGGLARSYGAGGTAMILSGMGRDGAIGAEALVAVGGGLLAQDEASSVVWGMPGAVAALSSAVMPPDALAAELVRRSRAPLWS